jgi:hypothetical protein
VTKARIIILEALDDNGAIIEGNAPLLRHAGAPRVEVAISSTPARGS